MRLLVIERGTWTVMAICDDRDGCQVQEFLDGLETDSRSDYDQVMAQLRRTATNGPQRNKRKSRPLEDKVFELKTRRGIRIPYFYDEGRVVICTQAMRKPKKAELNVTIARAHVARTQYFEAKQRAALEITEEEA
jgi:hypothetical protein